MDAVAAAVRLALLVVVALEAVWSQEPCLTPNQREGRCIPRADCASINELIKPGAILNEDIINFLRRSVCNEVPVKICCTDRVVPTTAAPDPDPEPFGRVTPEPAITRPGNWIPDPHNYECGLQILVDRILSGQNASIQEFTWYALLEYETKKGDRVFDCGGALINQHYVVTAAHCLDNVRLDDGQKLVNIRLGEQNTATDVDCEDEDELVICAPPPQNFTAQEIVLHPSYSKSDPNQHHDIALIRLNQPAELHQFVNPICLPDSIFQGVRVGQRASVTGFGHTGQRRHSVVKQKVTLPIVDQAECRKKWSRVNITDQQLCAGGEFNVDSCYGDSGGPLMSQSLYWTLEGVVSFGNRCGLENWPGIYTRVSAYTDWIKSVIRA